MHEEYDQLRWELEGLQRQFEEQGKTNPDLGHQVCRYPDDQGCGERLSESTWAAFIRHNSHLPDGKWQEWHVLNEGRWCGMFFGTGSLKIRFEALAAQVISVLEHLTKVSGASDYFFVNLPPNRGWDAWLRLLYDAGELCDQPKTKSATWGVPDGQVLPLASRTYWSRPDANGMSYPLHPECVSLVNDVFSASAETLNFFLLDLVQELPIAEYRDDLLPYENDGICVPPYLPKSPWEKAERKAVAEALEEAFAHAAVVALEAAELPKSEEPAQPRYDKQRRELWLGGKVIRKFRRGAIRQERLIIVFDKAGWGPRIDNPFVDCDDLEDVMPERCLRDAIDAFNRLSKEFPPPWIVFEGDGKNGVLWRVEEA